MLKDKMKEHLDAFCDATSRVLLRMRDEKNHCQVCGSPPGQQHLMACPIWPLIIARGNYSQAAEFDAKTPQEAA